MRRRQFLTLLGGLAVSPHAVRAQQGERMRRIGVLMAIVEGDPEYQAFLGAFRDGLQKLGWTEAGNIRIDYRWTGAETDAIQRFAKELVALQPDLILSSSTATTAALLKLTRTIPIIFTIAVDPIGSGFVASLPRPGGNVTGFINLDPNMVGKWLELLKEIAPHVTRVAAVYRPQTAPYFEIYLRPFKIAAQSLGMEAIVTPVSDMAGFESVCAAEASQPNSSIVLVPDPYMSAHRLEIASVAARHRLPSVYYNRAFADAGGLMSYGNDIADNYRRAAAYVNRVLRGEKPSELPVQFPAKFDLVINLK